MVIITFQYGRLGNKLLTYGHLLANSYSNGYQVYNYDFRNYFKNFPNALKKNESTRIDKLTLFITRILAIKLLVKILSRISKGNFIVLGKYVLMFDRNKDFDLNDKKFIELASSKYVFLFGWLYRDFENIAIHKKEIAKTFRTSDAVHDKLSQLFSDLRLKYDKIIGLHIRRGDYKFYKDGKYFFEIEEYKAFIHQLRGQFSADTTVLFFVTSNEKIAINSDDKINVFISNFDFIKDLYALSRCDLILGPISSFSSWASYIGDVPICHLLDRKQQVTLQDFKIHYEL